MKQHDEQVIHTFIHLLRQMGRVEQLQAELGGEGINSTYSQGRGDGLLQAAEQLRVFFDL